MDSGRVYFWSILTPQRWSALAPDFVEVEENQEYIEREDEFDIHPIEEINRRRLDLEDEDVNVLTVDAGAAESKADEFQMPVLLDIEASDSEDEVIAVGAGQFRRKSPGQGKEWMNDGDRDSGVSGDEHNASGRNGTPRSQSTVKRRRGD